jgi:hypothetical protein
MNWIKASVKLPPEDKEVLIRVDDQYFLAVYTANPGSFLLRNGNTIDVKDNEIFWTELIGP